jgi:hypothetical protein
MEEMDVKCDPDLKCSKCGESDNDYNALRVDDEDDVDNTWACMSHHLVCEECGPICGSCYWSVTNQDTCATCLGDVCKRHAPLKVCIDCKCLALLCYVCTSCCDFKPNYTR